MMLGEQFFNLRNLVGVRKHKTDSSKLPLLNCGLKRQQTACVQSRPTLTVNILIISFIVHTEQH